MMSTAGHSQDTPINLVDIAPRLAREGLASRTVFYFIQNQVRQTATTTGPSQLKYSDLGAGTPGQPVPVDTRPRPGARAWEVQELTPFLIQIRPA